MPTHGSWRPVVEISTSSKFLLIVFLEDKIELVGLTQKRIIIS